MISEEWLHTDEQHDVLISLREVLHQVERVAAGDLHCWKWAIIAIASAVTGALTCNLTGSMQIGALAVKDAKRTIRALQTDADTELPKRPYLAPPDELLQRACGQDLRFERAGPVLTISDDQQDDFDRLFKFRNSFSHFEPCGWSIETSGLPSICQNVLVIVEQVVRDGYSFRHISGDHRADLEMILLDVNRVLKVIRRSSH